MFIQILFHSGFHISCDMVVPQLSEAGWAPVTWEIYLRLLGGKGGRASPTPAASQVILIRNNPYDIVGCLGAACLGPPHYF